MPPPDRSLSLKDVVHWTISTLVRMAQRKEWGEIRIVVQAGQIMFVHEQKSYRDRLPVIDEPVPANLREHVTV